MRRHITRVLYAVAAAGITLATLGLAGAGSPATAAARSLGPPVYNAGSSGYLVTGRWFRYVSATVTVPPALSVQGFGGEMVISLANTPQPREMRIASILVRPGGGAGSVSWGWGGATTPFAVSPKAGDQLSVSIYYDRHGHASFAVTDLSQGITRTARTSTGNVTFSRVSLTGELGSNGPWPGPVTGTDTRLWKVADTHLTTYTATRGMLTGPWQTSQVIQTSTGTSAGTVIASPSGLWNNGANFGDWLRGLPVTYTSSAAGYTDSVGPFRFAATTMTVPPAQTPAANGGTLMVGLGHNGGPTPRPYASIEVASGGGAGSVSYVSNAAHGTFTVSPNPGDQLRVSVYYDRKGHYSLVVTDTTQATTQTVTVAAPYADSMPLNSAQVLAMFDNSTVTTPAADTQIWQLTASNVTTYGGDHGGILGPWATSRWIDTIGGTQTGAVVADATVPVNATRDFGVWLRHQ